MGVAIGDYNNDGHLDLHVTNMSSTAGNRILGRLFPGAKSADNVLVKLASGNELFENLGAGRFRDVTAEVGGLSGGWAWGGGFIDFDNDGARGHLHAERLHLRQVDERHLKPVLASGRDAATDESGKGSLREDQARLMFVRASRSAGTSATRSSSRRATAYLDISGVSGIDSLSDGRASVMADFDNDGDLDVFLTTLQGESPPAVPQQRRAGRPRPARGARRAPEPPATRSAPWCASASVTRR